MNVQPVETMVRPRPRLAPDGLLIAAILSASAGFLDGFSFLGHGHVFASAMTGNMVLLGIHAATDGAVGSYLAPLSAYVTGVLVAHVAGREGVRRRIGGRPYLVTLATQVLILVGLALAGRGLGNAALVSLITVGTAMQNASFRNIGTRTYNSVIMTGNLQAFSNAFAAGLMPPTRPKLAEAMVLGIVIAAFIGGAAGGALAVPPLGLHALLVPAALLALAWLALLASARAEAAAPAR